VTDSLPRQTYRTTTHAIAEQEIADALAKWANARQLKIGADPDDQQKSRIDRVLYRDYVVAFAEIKTCRYVFREIPHFTIGRRKVIELRTLQSIVRVPVLIVVRFGCGTLGYLDVTLDHWIVENWGRDDRGDTADREQGARFEWTQFKIICGVAEITHISQP
jgi:hypothetical protein